MSLDGEACPKDLFVMERQLIGKRIEYLHLLQALRILVQ